MGLMMRNYVRISMGVGTGHAKDEHWANCYHSTEYGSMSLSMCIYLIWNDQRPTTIGHAINK